MIENQHKDFKVRTLKGMIAYQKHGVNFCVPENWATVEDDLDETIRAITIECPNDGIYMIDIYNSYQAPSLENYIQKSMAHFKNELPLGSKIIDGPHRNVEKCINQEVETLGVRFDFIIRTLFRQQIQYLCSYFRVESENKVSFLSSQYTFENKASSQNGFDKIVSSYRVV